MSLNTSFNLNRTFENAATLHQAGRLSEAEGMYRNILAVDPKHVESLHLLGVIALQFGRNDVAVELIGQAIAANKRNAEFHNNMGVALRALGRLDEAVEHFKQAVKLKPAYADAHNNLGLACRDQGRFAESEERYRRALRISPDHAEAHYNLGIELSEQGKFAEAEEHYRQTTAFKPEFPCAYNNLGLVLMWQGRLAEAVGVYRQSLALKPDYGEAYTNLAAALVTAEEFTAALAALRCALMVDETNADARSLAVHCIKQLRSAEEASPVRDLVVRAVSQGWGRSIELAQVSASLIKRNPGIGECIERASKASPRGLPAEELFGSSGLAAADEDELLRSLLESTPVWDVNLERFLTAARFALLERAAAAPASAAAEEPAIGFYCSLARQCFINEYVFACGDGELEHAEALRERLAAALASGSAIPALWPVAVAAYFPLYSLPDAEQLLERASSDSRSGSWSDAVTGVLVQQVSEPREEQQLRLAIPRLTAIEDSVSLLVQRQYEESPYPRWVRTLSECKPVAADQYFRKRFRASFRVLGKSSDIEILVAGCGTGQHPVETAQRFSGARVLAVDLSLASLAYAQRKTREAGLTNVDYAQADILRLGSIGRTFDIIEACGVLHHMADPMAGWGVLLSLLRPGGLMSLGLYSELARADVVAARRFIAESGYGPSAQDIRRCRQELLALGDGASCKNVLRFSDFSSTSTCRDLLFHVQEHRFALPTIKAFLRENNLEFLGFDLAPGMAEAFRKSFPEGSFTDLDLWHIFEQENPATFSGMYQFWIQKIGVGMIDV